RPFYQEEKHGGGGVNAELDADERGRGDRIDIVLVTKFANKMDDELLNQVGAVSDGGDEGCARNCDATEWQTITLRADEKCTECEREQRELPDGGGEIDVVAFAQP